MVYGIWNSVEKRFVFGILEPTSNAACYNEKTNWSGIQTLVTPKGRETFRLLCLKAL